MSVKAHMIAFGPTGSQRNRRTKSHASLLQAFIRPPQGFHLATIIAGVALAVVVVLGLMHVVAVLHRIQVEEGAPSDVANFSRGRMLSGCVIEVW